MKIEVIGPFRGISGYDSHTRSFIREMRKQGVSLRATNFNGWSADLFPNAELNDIINHPDQSLTTFDITLHFLMPQQSNPKAGINICYTMFEGDRIVDILLKKSLKHELVIVPTASSLNAWINSGFPSERLRICSLGVDCSKFHPGNKHQITDKINTYAFTNYKYKFLNIADLRPRKNHLGLIRSWIRATSAKDDAVLLLKINPLEPLAKSAFEQDIIQLEHKLGKRIRDAAPIILISEYLTENDIQSLYNISTHYISMSHGEGWDLPLTEAMASGLHVIAPNHSAYESYLTNQVATLIPSRVTAAIPDATYRQIDNTWFENAQWWAPDEEYAVTVIRGVIDDALPRIDTGPGYAQANLSWEKAAKRLVGILEEVHIQSQQSSH